jgi:hypothetical protein
MIFLLLIFRCRSSSKLGSFLIALAELEVSFDFLLLCISLSLSLSLSRSLVGDGENERPLHCTTRLPIVDHICSHLKPFTLFDNFKPVTQQFVVALASRILSFHLN